MTFIVFVTTWIRVVIERRRMRQRIGRGLQTELRVVGIQGIFPKRVTDLRQIIKPVVKRLRHVPPRVRHLDFMILSVENPTCPL